MRELLKNFVDTPSKNFNIHLGGMTYCDGGYKIERKASQVYCFTYVISGNGTVVFGGKKIKAEAGDVCFFKAGDDHLYYSDSARPWTVIWFNVTGKIVDSLVELYGIDGCVFKSCRVFSLFDEFYKNIDSSLDKNTVKDDNVIILHKIVQAMAQCASASRTNTLSDAEVMRVYIEANFDKTISVEQLATLINKSASQVIRTFKKTYDSTPYEYALKQKMDAACKMLVGTKMSVKDISLKLGFKNEHYFSSAFKTQLGITPLKYRKNK